MLVVCHLTAPSAQIIPTIRPLDMPQSLLPRKTGVQYSADERAGMFFVKTDDQALNGKILLVEAPKNQVRKGLSFSQSKRK